MVATDRKILLVDNYDSFTYIIREYLGQLYGFGRVDVVKNDQISFEKARTYSGWILSPGPGLPHESGVLLNLVKSGMDHIPMLGICLGHQAIAEAAGAQLRNLGTVRHGHQVRIKWLQSSEISLGKGEYENAGLYHSWVIDEDSLTPNLTILAKDESGHIMAIKYKDRPVFGVQFHPESILTSGGSDLIGRFLSFL